MLLSLRLTVVTCAALFFSSANALSCSSTSTCASPGTFCNYEFGNFGNCVTCRPDACHDSTLRENIRGVVDCFKNCDTSSIVSSEHTTACRGYILSGEEFIPFIGPFPVDCGSRYGDKYALSNDQEYTCCNGEGRHSVGSSQMGGFDFVNGSPEIFPICNAYNNALQAILCHPDQGKFIRTYNGINQPVLRVCRESCDTVFSYCGLPGEVFPDWTTYYDGTSLCYEVWGGFSSHQYDGCGFNGFPCQINLAIDVVDTDCLAMTPPSDDDIDHYIREEFWPDRDVCHSSSLSTLVVIVIPIVVGVFGCSCCALLACVLMRRQTDTTSDPAAGSEEKKDAQEDPPVAKAVAIEENNDPFRTPEKGKKAPENPQLIEAVSATENEGGELVAENPPSPNIVDATPVMASVALAVIQETAPPSVADIGDSASFHAVKNWIADNPSAAAVLTPRDVASVLAKTTFSLDRPEVAKVLAGGISKNGGSLTTKHILAAMEMSSYLDGEVAMVMAPHVVDPENKEDVLEALRMDFTKDEVSMRFPKL